MHGPNKDKNEMSVNIEITNKKLFPSNNNENNQNNLKIKEGKPPTNPANNQKTTVLRNVTNENVDIINRMDKK